MGVCVYVQYLYMQYVLLVFFVLFYLIESFLCLGGFSFVHKVRDVYGISL